MGFKNWLYWVRGGVIGLIVFIVIYVFLILGFQGGDFPENMIGPFIEGNGSVYSLLIAIVVIGIISGWLTGKSKKYKAFGSTKIIAGGVPVRNRKKETKRNDGEIPWWFGFGLIGAFWGAFDSIYNNHTAVVFIGNVIWRFLLSAVVGLVFIKILNIRKNQMGVNNAN